MAEVWAVVQQLPDDCVILGIFDNYELAQKACEIEYSSYISLKGQYFCFERVRLEARKFELNCIQTCESYKFVSPQKIWVGVKNTSDIPIPFPGYMFSNSSWEDEDKLLPPRGVYEREILTHSLPRHYYIIKDNMILATADTRETLWDRPY